MDWTRLCLPAITTSLLLSTCCLRRFLRPILREAWLLGLGHLGNAYLWTLATLPYPMPADVRFHPLDFDKMEDTNLETGVLFEPDDEGELKTCVINRWLTQRGFDTRLLERRFDGHFQVQDGEVRFAFCGFDDNAVRRHLASAGFDHVVETGLGGRAGNFDTINLHTFPQARSADDLWPDLDPADIAKEERQNERIARENGAYAYLGDDICGKVRIAGKSIVVPFVGVTVAALVIAESLRLFHENGAWLGQVKFRLGTAEVCAAHTLANIHPSGWLGFPTSKSGSRSPTVAEILPLADRPVATVRTPAAVQSRDCGME